VIGPYAGAAHTGGDGSSAVTPLYTVAPMDGLKKHLGTDMKIAYDDGSDPQSAITLAKSADVAVVMVGNKDREGRDRPDLSLPGKQNELVSAVATVNSHTVVVLKTGGAVLMPWFNQVAAVLEVWYGSQSAFTTTLTVKVSCACPLYMPRVGGTSE